MTVSTQSCSGLPNSHFLPGKAHEITLFGLPKSFSGRFWNFLMKNCMGPDQTAPKIGSV